MRILRRHKIFSLVKYKNETLKLKKKNKIKFKCKKRTNKVLVKIVFLFIKFVCLLLKR